MIEITDKTRHVRLGKYLNTKSIKTAKGDSLGNFGFLNKRMDYSGKFNPNQVRLCMEWIDKWAATSEKFDRRVSSYRLKHMVEWCTGQYVPNGAFILAAILRGFDYKRFRKGPNAFFKIDLTRARKNPDKSGWNHHKKTET